jgi:hypothetical protein
VYLEVFIMRPSYYDKDLDIIRWWLSQDGYYLCKFSDGWGMYRRDGGGSATYFRKKDLDKLVKAGIITKVKKPWGYDYENIKMDCRF